MRGMFAIHKPACSTPPSQQTCQLKPVVQFSHIPIQQPRPLLPSVSARSFESVYTQFSCLSTQPQSSVPTTTQPQIPMGAAVSAVSAIATVATVVARCLGAFREAPQAANSTVDQIERHAMEEARKQAAEAKKKEEEARKKVEAAKKKEQEANRHADEARAREQAANQREHEARQREEQIRNEKARLEKEAEAARAREEEARRQAEEARQNLAQGIQPVVWPTAQELAAAKRNAGYRGDLLHFAVCGPSGSGKSSLINALRGLRNNQQGAAKTGVVECTEKMQRYPDPRKEMPYPRFVWYDVPGAGTSKIPGWQYFIQQGLFIFDFVVLVYDVRFTKIDADILDNCRRFKIPAFIVRSKANQHIRNLREDEELDYPAARDKYVHETQRDIKANLQQYGLWNEGDPLQLYIVSNSALYDYIKDAEECNREEETGGNIPNAERNGGKKKAEYIDEPKLVLALLETAFERRYLQKPGGSSGTHLGTAVATVLSEGLSRLGMGGSSQV